MQMQRRVPDAVRHSSCRSAEPGPYQTPAFVTAPALQRTASQVLRAALRPGHKRSRRLLRRGSAAAQEAAEQAAFAFARNEIDVADELGAALALFQHDL